MSEAKGGQTTASARTAGSPVDDYYVDCCNEECGWTGLRSETVHPKHCVEEQLCPVCTEVTEPHEF